MSDRDVKNYLKAAKQALMDGNAEYCLQLAQDALKIDKKSYFAYLFIGKASHSLNDLVPSVKAYRSAIALNRKDQNAWRGWLLVAKSHGNVVEFFECVTEYAEMLLDQGLPLVDLIGEIKLFVKQKSSKAEDKDLVMELYWKNLLPGSELGQLTHGAIEPFDKVVSSYLDILVKKEQTKVSQASSTHRSTHKVEQAGSLNDRVWDIYSKSEIPELYLELINTTDDTEKRRAIEENYLKYKIKVLKVSPLKESSKLFKEVKEIVEGMVSVKHTSFYVWSLYFDLLDFDEFSSIPEENVKTFLNLFNALPLGQIVYAYVRSDLCPYNIVLEEDQKSNKKSDRVEQSKDNDDDEDLESEEQKLKELESAGDEEPLISAEDLLAIMEDGLSSCKTSLFAYRIVLTYRIYLKLYSTSIQLCQDAIQLLTRTARDYKYPFPKTKGELLVNYAVILTYHETPRNYRRALELYDQVLKDFPENTKAIIGKGIILSDGGSLEQAKELLEKVVSSNPENIEAANELAWVEIKLGHYEVGRQKLINILPKVIGKNLFYVELKAVMNWRIAQSYLKQGQEGKEETEGPSPVEKAYEYLVDSLRSSKDHAPSYTTLGEIYLYNYQDTKRARKCFLKSFELDPSEVVAAWNLVKEFTENLEWDLAESFSKRLLDSENSRRKLGQDSWPYRVLGMAALEAQDEAKAIEWFQNAIRIDPKDTESWVGLGESYYGCGRLEAAVKVFKKALELKPDHWIAKYLLGVVLSHLSEFDEAISTLGKLLEERPDEECVIFALTEALLSYSSEAVLQGFFGKAVGLALKANELIPKGNKKSFNFWRSINNLVEIFLQIQSKIDQFPADTLLQVFKETENFEIDEAIVSSLIESEKIVELAALFLTYANQAALSLNPRSRALRSSSLYNLGLSQVIAFLKTHNIQYREDAITSLKEAIKLQNNYPEAWIVLGVATTSANPRVAQHCFIKASSIDSKNVDIWSNLALLFLRYEDYSLASEAYSKGQSLAPNQPISWLGNALTSEALGDTYNASRLFTHAFILGNGRSPSAQLAYGVNLCMQKIGKNDDVRNIQSIHEFSSAALGMVQYLKHYPLDTFGLAITCLILERLNDYELGEEIALKLLNILEKAYEENEDEASLQSFASIKSQLSRFALGLKNYDLAIENALEVLGLSEDVKTVVSSRTVLGLSYFFLDKFDEALDEFKEILNISGDARRLVVLIAQVLYVYDTEETKQAALDQLFHNIETAGSSLLVTLVIGAISVVDDLEDYWGIIKGELESLSLGDLIEDKFKNVPFLIAEIDKKLQSNQTNEALQRSAFYFPDDLRIWNELDKNVAVKIAAQGQVSAVELSEAYLHRKNKLSLQRSVFLAPWNREIYPLE